MIVIDLPWPPKELSPNARVHRMQRARVARQYRHDCAWATVEASGGIHRCPRLTGSDLELIAEFRMPDKRWRDADNLLAMIKSGLDGVCDATGINDRAFHRVIVERVMDGAGIVRLTIRESNDRVEGRDAALSRRVPSHDGLCGNGSEVGAGDTAMKGTQ